MVALAARDTLRLSGYSIGAWLRARPEPAYGKKRAMMRSAVSGHAACRRPPTGTWVRLARARWTLKGVAVPKSSRYQRSNLFVKPVRVRVIALDTLEVEPSAMAHCRVAVGVAPPNISGRCETFASLPHCVPKPLVAKLVDHAKAGIDKLVDLGRGREWLST